MINIKVYTKNKKTGTRTSESTSSANNTNIGGGGSGSWLEKYFIYDSERDCVICKRKLGSNDNVIGFIPIE